MKDQQITKSVNRSWLAFRFFNVASFDYSSWFVNIVSLGPPTRLPQSLSSRSLPLKSEQIAFHKPAGNLPVGAKEDRDLEVDDDGNPVHVKTGSGRL